MAFNEFSLGNLINLLILKILFFNLKNWFQAHWAPPNERSRLVGIANAGAQIGNVAALSLGGYLCVSGFDGGWPSIFYTFGNYLSQIKSYYKRKCWINFLIY